MNIIYFPHKLGQKKNGVQDSYKLFNLVGKVVECKNDGEHLFENLKNLYEATPKVSPNLNIGGDHLWLCISADSLNKYDNLKVLWFDAHPDINTYEKSESKSYHGMPLSFLTGLDKNDNFPYIKKHLDFKNLFYIGIRDIDDYEAEVIKKYNIQYIKPEDFNRNSDAALKKINDFIGDDPYHISFDVDGLDPCYIPCTGTAVKEGLDLYKVKYILDNLNTDNLVNMDLTELNFELGDEQDQFKTLENTKYVLERFL